MNTSSKKHETTRKDLVASKTPPQERNRMWWEKWTMTYQDWSEETRMLDGGGFEEAAHMFLTESGTMRAFDFSKFRGKRVLEIGCGVGLATAEFARYGAHVTAIDITEAAVRETKRYLTLQNLEAEVLQHDAEDLESLPRSVDYVFSWGVIHHSNRTERIVAGLNSVMSSGAKGLAMVYNKHSYRYYLGGLWQLLAKGRLFQGESLSSVQRFFTDGYYQRHFTKWDFADIFRAQKLHVDRVTIDSGTGDRLWPAPKWLRRAIQRRFGWYLVIEFSKP